MAESELQFLFGQYVPRCRHRVDKHFGYCVLQYLDGGAVELSIDREQYRLEGRYFFSSYPGPRIAFHPVERRGTWVHRYLAFQGALVRRWQEEGLFPIKPQAIRWAQADYAMRFDQLLSLSRRNDRWGQTRAILALETILTELAEARAQASEAPQWLASATARMQELGSTIDCEQLARDAGMPARTFRRRFTSALGRSPHRYLIDCRIGHAKEMLGGTDLPIKSIAEQLGYHDISFFTRQFRLETGVPPATYRRSREA